VTNTFEVPEPIINSPYNEPGHHWRIEEGTSPVKLPGRRPAMYWYRPPTVAGVEPGDEIGTGIELKLVNLIRARVKTWRDQGWPGVSRTSLEMLRYWWRDGRRLRLFFAQLEAAETIIFLREARADFHHGIDIPSDQAGESATSLKGGPFRRYACKMATGAGKTMVMGMLAAWSILNKVHARSDGRFSDVVLVVCPNVTIRDRLAELKPESGEASIYRKSDLVPQHLMADLTRGRVLVTNWHVFEPAQSQVGGVSARVARTGRRQIKRETIRIADKTTTARGTRYLALEDFERQRAAGLLHVLSEVRDKQGHLVKVEVERERYVESDTAMVARLLGREVGGKQNIMVFNDEAHHAYRIEREQEVEEAEEVAEDEEEREEIEEDVREATVWVEGLDRIHRLRGINFCVDLSATPYWLSRVSRQANRPFPWVVSEFGLTDAIESGLVKIPQLAVRDTTGAEIPGYFNIWRWILPRLTPGERGGRKGSVKPEAVLKWAHTPIAMLGGLWEVLRKEWETSKDDARPPVFILVCKNTKIARLVYEWLADDKAPAGIPPAGLAGFRNADGQTVTIRVDSKVVHETDTGEVKNDESRWMRFTLDTVGRREWPRDVQGRPIFPAGFEELAGKMDRPLHPPGQDVRCIVSVGMLTEGWDCNTVTHIIGLRPFMSQLLCEQVVGRGLRRTSYDVGPDGRLTEEVAKILGVPFEVIPFKENRGAAMQPPPKRNHVRAVPEKAWFEISFPRVEGYRRAIRNRVNVDWAAVPSLLIDPTDIPTEVQMKGQLLLNRQRPTLTSPGSIAEVTLEPYLVERRFQELHFDLARDLTRTYVEQSGGVVPAHVLFPQVVGIVKEYLQNKVTVRGRGHLLQVFMAPYYGWVVERLAEAIRPDGSESEPPELPIYERSRPSGSTAEVDFWTSKDVREVEHSHVNYVVADTAAWEQQASYRLDTHPVVEAFVKNAGLGLAIPYLDNGQYHDYLPDFMARLHGNERMTLILEIKGFDRGEEVKRAAAERWVRAVNAGGQHGRWAYAVVKDIGALDRVIKDVVTQP